MKFYACPKCEGRIYFENLMCLQCGAQLGYLPSQRCMADVSESSRAAGFSVCANRSALLCNWLVEVTDTAAAPEPALLCVSCQHTRTIPPQDAPPHQSALQKLEQAKRYLFYSLIGLNLPIPRCNSDSERGLVFDFLVQLPGHAPITTGHASGVITINAAEADDAKREQKRVLLNEPYRTVLGHLRHEIGHYYWDLLVSNTPYLESFRRLFGDERIDYAQSLQTHYETADQRNWQGRYISHYASSHPWEDWAETWAHYLHIGDAMETAAAWGVLLADHAQSISMSDFWGDEFRERLVKDWLPLSQYLNAACRSLGEPDAYPFILPDMVLDKLSFVHEVIRSAASDKQSGG
ncbi:MAG: putative zinc-binding metallopeptidase [Steroidobacteraceae bacterium]